MRHFAILVLLLFAQLHADYNLENVSGWTQAQAQRHPYGYPYLLEASGDWIGDSNFTKDSIKGDHIRFATWEVELEALIYSYSRYNEGLNLAFTYEQTHLDWEYNPFFDRRDFNNAGLSLVFYTERFCRWSWVAQATYLIDANNWGFIDYATYNWLLWGRWAFSDFSNFHLGLFAQTGMHLPLILPILGGDFQIGATKISLLFPLNLSLSYAFDENWSFDLRGRWWSTRHRVGQHAHLSQAIWRYTNYGLELAANYHLSDNFEADFHGGYACGGTVKVAEHNGRHSHTFHFRPAAYFGALLTMSF